jgi:hypothetical protein
MEPVAVVGRVVVAALARAVQAVVVVAAVHMHIV